MRDFDAWGWLDVSGEQVLSRLHDMTPLGRERVGMVIGERVRASQARQRNLEELEPAVARLDIDPPGDSHYGLICRAYRLEDDRISPLPSKDMIRRAFRSPAMSQPG